MNEPSLIQCCLPQITKKYFVQSEPTSTANNGHIAREKPEIVGEINVGESVQLKIIWEFMVRVYRFRLPEMGLKYHTHDKWLLSAAIFYILQNGYALFSDYFGRIIGLSKRTSFWRTAFDLRVAQIRKCRAL